MRKVLSRSFYARPPVEVAVELLNKVLVVSRPGEPDRAGRIVEVEAYGADDDPASHGHRRRTPRNDTMFGPAGRLYVYFTYGMHFCTNISCGRDGVAAAVLLRGLEPIEGLDAMRLDRAGCQRDRDLCAGPGRLSRALGLDRSYDGADVVAADRGVSVVDDGTPPPEPPSISTRVGVSAAVDVPWRFYVSGAAGLSRPG